MANYNDLITAIDSVIKTNNRREITGQLLQNVLNTMVGSLGENYQLAGFATPTTNPHQPDQNVFYVASQAGVYTQFDNIVLGDGISFLMWKNGAWTSQTIANVTQSWVQQNFVSKEWFRKVFRVYDEDGLEIVPNDMDSVVDNIKAMVGLWTNEYLSALGMGRDGGGTTQTLAQLNDVQLGTLENGDALVYNTAIHKWENKQIQTGVDMSVVWAALAANTNEQINASHLATALSSYVTSANLSIMLNDYATKTWAAQNFITVEWFDKLFQLYNGTEAEANKIAPNGALPVDQTQLNIEAMFGFWTKKYISALGQGDDGTSYTTLAQLNDVNLTNPTANQVLTYNGTHWVNAAAPSGASALSGLTDVDISTLADKDLLQWDYATGKWKNVVLSTAMSGYATTSQLDNYLPLSGGTISGGINPNADSTINLGTATAKYHYIYAHRLVRLQSIAKGDTYDSYQLTLPDKSGTIAVTSDIPTNNNQLTNGAGYVTSSGVTSVATGTGLTGGTITTSGTISINSTYQTYISHGESAYNSLGNYLPLSGGTMTGGITCSTSGKNLVWGNITIYGGGSNGNTNSIYIGDDVTLGDCNVSGSFGMKSTNYNAGFRFFDLNGNSIGGIQSTNGTLQWINAAGTAYDIIHGGNIGSQSVNYATSAGKATNDGNGDAISSTYLKLSGGKFSAANGASFDNYGNIHVGSNASTDSWNIYKYNHGSGDMPYFCVRNSSGYVGIGLENPTEKLHVDGGVRIGNAVLKWDSTNNALKISAADGTSAVNVYSTGGLSALGAGKDSGGGGNYLPLYGGTMTGSIQVGWSDVTKGVIKMWSNAGWLDPYCNVRFGTGTHYWSVINENITDSNLFCVASNGNVNIGYGETTGVYKLDVRGAIRSEGLYFTDKDAARIDEFGNYKMQAGSGYWHVDSYTQGICIVAMNSSGYVGIGNSTSVSYKLHVQGQVGATGFVNTSDIRKKNVIKDIDLRLDQIAKAPTFEYYWLDPNIDHDLHVGTSAQYWEGVLPQVVTTAKDEMGTLSMQYGVAALISVTTVARKVMTHEEKIALLETRVSALEKENGEQEMLINSLQEELAKFKAA